MNYVYKTMPSPVGKLKLVASARSLAGILWENDKSWRVPHLNSAVEDNDHPVLLETEKQLTEYFAGTRRKFTLPLDFTGTDFNKQVWQSLLTIPCMLILLLPFLVALISEEETGTTFRPAGRNVVAQA